MKRMIAIGGVVLAIIGTFFGLLEWSLNSFIMELCDYPEPLNTLSTLSWFVETSFIGVAVIAIGVSASLPEKPNS